jgi:multidrug efflux pump
MSFTDIFVRRPVLSLVVSLLVLLIGIRAAMLLPIREFPFVETANITVKTTYPGASPDLMQGFITTPIAQAVATAEGVEYLTSSTSVGSSTVTARLRLGSNTDRAMTDIMTKVNQVRSRLPRESNDPVIQRESAEPTAVMYIAFKSDRLGRAAVGDFVTRVAQPLASTVPGVSEALVTSASIAMRVWVDPARMAARGLTAADVAAALRTNNVQAAAGLTKGVDTSFEVRAGTDIRDVESFRQMVVKAADGALVHLSDIATVELGEQNYNAASYGDDDEAVYLVISATPSGNPLTIVRDIRAQMPDWRKNMPPGMTVDVNFDSAQFVQSAINRVIETLVETVVIVVLVIFLFLGTLRSVLIPIVTVPLSIVGATALMLLAGFSLNLLTLLAMVMAIGLVVDDAIVVLENVYRHIEDGKSPVESALLGAREIAMPVIAMTITLAAVYAPIGFLTGLTGSLFREFAFTLAGSVLVSALIALTLSPMMSSFLLNREMMDGPFVRRVEHVLGVVTERYARLLHRALSFRAAIFAFCGCVVIAIPVLFLSTKHELAPTEDTGAFLISFKGPRYANLDYMEKFGSEVRGVFKSMPEGWRNFMVLGNGGLNIGFGGLILKPWDERSRSASQVVQDFQMKVGGLTWGRTFAFVLPSLPGAGGGLPVQMTVRSANAPEAVYEVMERIKDKARKSGMFAVVDSDLAFDNPTAEVTIDRAKANELGVRMQDIADTLAILMGENYVNRFNLQGRSYDVIPQVRQEDRLTPDKMGQFYVRTAAGTLTPLSTVVKVSTGRAPSALTQFNQLNSATFGAVPFPWYTMGEVVKFLQDTADEVLPQGFSYDWMGQSRQFVQEGNQLTLSFALGLLVIYLVLAAQFESLRDPLVILVTVPLSVLGALIPIFLGVTTLNIYTQIGLLTLVGLISKHGILMVEFANRLQREEGLSRRAAVERAAAVRLRPILMTTAAMVAGLIPMVLAGGAGATARFAIGIVIVTGMLVGTLFTLFVVPAVYTVLARDHSRAARSERATSLAA